MSNNTADREVILSISHVDISFDVGGKKKFVAVKDANFDIYKGETFALVGESGSGKTTLGRAIMRINPCSNGEILFEGKRISGKISREEDRNVVRNIQMIFQDPAASLNERATIEYCISEGLYNFHLYKDEEERIAKVDQALKDVGLLPEHKSRYPHEFSGGQRQRVGIARAMIMDPKLIVADEPISAHVPFHRARPFGRPVHCRPHRRHPSRRDRGDRGFRDTVPVPAASVHHLPALRRADARPRR